MNKAVENSLTHLWRCLLNKVLVSEMELFPQVINKLFLTIRTTK